MTLKRIGLASCAKVMGAVYALFGLVFGLLMSIVSLIGAGASEGVAGGSALFGVAAVVVLPILYGIIGVIGGVIGAFAYNLVAGRLGGLELDLS